MKASPSSPAAGAASLLFMLVSPFFSPTSAFMVTPSLFGGAQARRHASSPSSSSSSSSPSSSFYASPRSTSSWSPSTAVPAAAGESGDDGFSFGDLQRELSRRRAEEATAPGSEQQQQQQQQASQQASSSSSSPSPGAEGREAFMEEQMSLRKMLLKAFVLVYNQGQPEEGVYTLFVEGRNVLRAWEDKPEAARYALMLRAEDLPLGKPTELPMTQIISFCKENGVGLELIPRGRGLQPPSRNKPEFDFDCSPQEGGANGRPGAAASSAPSPGEESLFTPQELARIKSQFEKSLESDEEA